MSNRVNEDAIRLLFRVATSGILPDEKGLYCVNPLSFERGMFYEMIGYEVDESCPLEQMRKSNYFLYSMSFPATGISNPVFYDGSVYKTDHFTDIGVGEVIAFWASRVCESYMCRMNDKAYNRICDGIDDDELACEYYTRRVSLVNHARIIQSIVDLETTRRVDSLGVYFDKVPAVGEEVFLTYGWSFWKAIRNSASVRAMRNERNLSPAKGWYMFTMTCISVTDGILVTKMSRPIYPKLALYSITCTAKSMSANVVIVDDTHINFWKADRRAVCTSHRLADDRGLYLIDESSWVDEEK